MAEVDKALDDAVSSDTPTGAEETQMTGGGTPATPTTAALTEATNTTTAPAIITATAPAIITAAAAAVVASTDAAVDNDDNTEHGAASSSSASSAKLRESLRAELELYTSGVQVNASPCYTALEAVFGKRGVQSRVNMLMNCIEGKLTQARRCRAGLLFQHKTNHNKLRFPSPTYLHDVENAPHDSDYAVLSVSHVSSGSIGAPRRLAPPPFFHSVALDTDATYGAPASCLASANSTSLIEQIASEEQACTSASSALTRW